MRLVVAPDSFGGALDSVRAADAIGRAYITGANLPIGGGEVMA